MTWARFKTHFVIEHKEYKKTHGLTSKSTGYQVVNATNQALLEAQDDFKTCTTNFLDTFQQTLHREVTPPQQPAFPHHQASHAARDENLCKMIEELKDQNKQLLDTIKILSENKENRRPTKPNQKKNKQDANATWFYCYSCGYNTDHGSDGCTSNLKAATHKNDATFTDRKGGSGKGWFRYKRAKGL